MKPQKTRFVFGPVPSRRLGLSLGIDLLPFKTCSMDCIYCECGATTDLTCKRKEFYPVEDVIRDFDEVMSKHPKLDYVTFSGVGEPTLYAGIGQIIQHIRKNFPALKICLLTNASLLNDDSLLEELNGLTAIIPSMDGSTEEELFKINRQDKAVTLSSVVSGLLKFRRKYPSTNMKLEIFIVPGINDSMESAERFRDLAAQIQPDCVQLNSLDRPGVVEWLKPADPELLEKIASIIRQKIPVEIIARHKLQVKIESAQPDVQQYNDLILKTLSSRPCTADDLAITLGIPSDRVLPHLRRMERAGLLIPESGPRGIYYKTP